MHHPDNDETCSPPFPPLAAAWHSPTATTRFDMGEVVVAKKWILLGLVSAVAGAAISLGAGGAAGGSPITATPEREAPQLGCGRAPTMVIHTGLYVPGTAASPATSPAEALERIVGKHYPSAPRARFARVQEDSEGSVKYHVRADGKLLASFLVSQAEGEFWVEEIALCEATAKRWAR